MRKTNNFIVTQDMETAKELSNIGFTLVQESSGIWTFLNCKNLTFTDNQKRKFIYSDKISF